MDNRYIRDRARRRMRRDRYARGMDGTYYPEYEHHTPYVHPTNYNVGHYITDGRDYDDTHEYHRELEMWTDRLKHSDRFRMAKEEVIKKAHEMGARFHDYDEAEFYVTYLMLASDFKHVANDPHQYVIMAKEWLEDYDAKRKGSEKLCAYLYSIVLGDD